MKNAKIYLRSTRKRQIYTEIKHIADAIESFHRVFFPSSVHQNLTTEDRNRDSNRLDWIHAHQWNCCYSDLG